MDVASDRAKLICGGSPLDIVKEYIEK